MRWIVIAVMLLGFAGAVFAGPAEERALEIRALQAEMILMQSEFAKKQERLQQLMKEQEAAAKPAPAPAKKDAPK